RMRRLLGSSAISMTCEPYLGGQTRQAAKARRPRPSSGPMCTKTGGGVSSGAARTQSSIVLRLVFAKKSDIERLIAWLGEIGYGEARAAEAQIQNLDEEKLAVEVAIHGQSDPVWLRLPSPAVGCGGEGCASWLPLMMK